MHILDYDPNVNSCFIYELYYICVIVPLVLNMKKIETKTFLGYTIKPTGNQVKFNFDEVEYIQLIKDAHNVGIKSVAAYLMLLTSKCVSCGSDKIQLELIKRDVRKTSNGHSVHLFIFEDSDINSQVDKTELTIQATLAFTLQIENTSSIYTPKINHRYKDDKNIATLVIFKNNIRTHTINCVIKNNKVYPHETT